VSTVHVASAVAAARSTHSNAASGSTASTASTGGKASGSRGPVAAQPAASSPVAPERTDTAESLECHFAKEDWFRSIFRRKKKTANNASPTSKQPSVSHTARN
jgi:hypothetical protein